LGYAKEEEEEGTAKWAPCFVFPGLSGNLRVAGALVAACSYERQQGGAGVGTVSK
jgi:hypothetical protein